MAEHAIEGAWSRKDNRQADSDAPSVGLRKRARGLFGKRQHIRAWQSGDEAEIDVVKVLNHLAVDSILALHNRRIPHSQDNIDHIAIGPSGIYVIDAKRYAGQRVEVRRSGRLLSTRRAELLVDGRWPTALFNGLESQVSAVLAALHCFDLPKVRMVQPVLCLVDAEWGLLSGKLSVDGVAVVERGGLEQLVQEPGPLDARTRHAVQAHLAERLPQLTEDGSHGLMSSALKSRDSSMSSATFQ